MQLSFVGAGRGGPQHTSAAQARKRAKAGQVRARGEPLETRVPGGQLPQVPNFSEQRPSSLCQSGERLSSSLGHGLKCLGPICRPLLHASSREWNPPGPTSSLITPYPSLDPPLFCAGVVPLARCDSRLRWSLPCVLFMPDIRCSHGNRNNLLNYGVRHRRTKDSFQCSYEQNRKRRNREGKRRSRYNADQTMVINSIAETVGRVWLFSTQRLDSMRLF